MTKREIGLVIIRAEVAETGKAGRDALRAYLERRISRAAFNDACAEGLRIYTARQASGK